MESRIRQLSVGPSSTHLPWTTPTAGPLIHQSGNNLLLLPIPFWFCQALPVATTMGTLATLLALGSPQHHLIQAMAIPPFLAFRSMHWHSCRIDHTSLPMASMPTSLALTPGLTPRIFPRAANCKCLTFAEPFHRRQTTLLRGDWPNSQRFPRPKANTSSKATTLCTSHFAHTKVYQCYVMPIPLQYA